MKMTGVPTGKAPIIRAISALTLTQPCE
ncbi:hypothetical protein FRIGORI9N_420015 [Frigoribacterium sp. 9N]|nr:hypothetical protein FRIGORI9N_420015 [Frigoribacterium sp. 9N]